MAFKLTVRRDAASVKESGGQFIGQSGIYPITTNFVSLSKSAGGAVQFAINLTYEGSTQTLYGPTIQNKNGDENEIGYRVLNKLFVLADMPAGAEPTIEEETHAVGKDNENKQFNVIVELSDLDLQVQVQEEFSKYQGEVKRKLNIVNFFLPDGATADEVLAKENGQEVTPGTQLAKILEKESTTKHKLGKDENKVPVTEEEVAAFKAAKASGSTQSTTTAAPVVKKAKNLFA